MSVWMDLFDWWREPQLGMVVWKCVVLDVGLVCAFQSRAGVLRMQL